MGWTIPFLPTGCSNASAGDKSRGSKGADSHFCVVASFVRKNLEVVASAEKRRIFQAVLHGMSVVVLYASAHGKSWKWRRMMPHALAWSGHRRHARAWCLENQAYQDFVLGRMEEKAGWPEAVEPVPVRDEAWDTFQTVERRPHPELEEERQVAVALEDGMEKRRLKVRVRQAMVQYLETALGLVPADGKPLPPRLQRVR